MRTATVARAEQLAAQLLGAGIPTTLDPAAVTGMAPVVLIAPPRLAFDHAEPTATWRLLCVASTADQRQAWDQLDDLLLAVTAELPCETADHALFAAAPGDDPLPAYALTLTD